MKIKLLLLLCLVGFTQCKNAAAQTVVLNGDLEKINPKTKLPVGWQNFMSNYTYRLDSTVVQQGKYSLSITSNSEAEFGAISCVIPYTFKGKELVVKGYIKTENVVGAAGIWVRVDGTSAFNNMGQQNIHGTTDWKEYTFSLPYDDEKAININVGGLLSGKGKIWIDNIRLYLDGKPIEEAKIKPIELNKAQKDTAFAKGSGISLTSVNQQQVQNLALLGQVWGFVKYHHPAVARGDINIDAELFRVMPGVINAQNTKEASAAIEQWVDKLGVPEKCGSCKPYNGDNIVQKPDYGMIFDRGVVGASLADKLTYILNNHNTGKNYYVGMRPGIGNPDFKNEMAYERMTYPDAGYRLLCLYRYWNIIQYYSPYKNTIGRDWNTALADMIPKFVAAQNAQAYQLEALAMISSIHDTHANIWSTHKGLEDYRGKYAPPFRAKFVEGKLTVTAYYNDTLGVKEKFKVGDVITAINGTNVDDLIKKYSPITAASNFETQLRDMPRIYLLRSNNPQFQFTVLRDGKSLSTGIGGLLTTKLNYAALYNPDPKAPGYKLIDNQIGYVYPAKYFDKDLRDIQTLFMNTKGIIIDMRCYPSQFMPFTFVPYIKTGDNFNFVKLTAGNVSQPGLFTMSKPIGTKANNYYKGKVVVIVNEESQSQAEYTTMAFQSSANVKVIGSITAGADGDVSPIYLPGGIRTMISGLGVFYPDGTPTQRKGVKIDEQVKPTIAGIKAGRDEPLERAKAIIMGN
ncbi:MAG: S41 family peptidase [Bacteroidota bacterium]